MKRSPRRSRKIDRARPDLPEPLRRSLALALVVSVGLVACATGRGGERSYLGRLTAPAAERLIKRDERVAKEFRAFVKSLSRRLLRKASRFEGSDVILPGTRGRFRWSLYPQKPGLVLRRPRGPGAPYVGRVELSFAKKMSGRDWGSDRVALVFRRKGQRWLLRRVSVLRSYFPTWEDVTGDRGYVFNQILEAQLAK